MRNTCNNLSYGAGSKFLWLHLAVIIFASSYNILTFNYFLSIGKRFKDIRSLHHNMKKSLNNDWVDIDNNDEGSSDNDVEVLVSNFIFKFKLEGVI